jgi:hypothetical protein
MSMEGGHCQYTRHVKTIFENASVYFSIKHQVNHEVTAQVTLIILIISY